MRIINNGLLLLVLFCLLRQGLVIPRLAVDLYFSSSTLHVLELWVCAAALAQILFYSDSFMALCSHVFPLAFIKCLTYIFFSMLVSLNSLNSLMTSRSFQLYVSGRD